MADVKDVGAGTAVRAVTAAKSGEVKVVGAEAVLSGELKPAGDTIAIDRKPAPRNPEERARGRLEQVDTQIDREIETLDKAISQRSQGLSWWKRWNDPVLRDLQQARWELLRAKKDVAAAKQALAGGTPIWKYALAYMGPDLWRREPDLGRAENAINSAIGRLAHAEHLVGEAYNKLPPPVIYAREKGDAVKCPHPQPQDSTLRGNLRRLLGDIGATRFTAESARQDIWEAQETRPAFPRPVPEPWPPTREFPPYRYYYDRLPAKPEEPAGAATKAGT